MRRVRSYHACFLHFIPTIDLFTSDLLQEPTTSMAGKDAGEVAPMPAPTALDAVDVPATASQSVAQFHYPHSHSHSSGCATRLKPKMQWLTKKRRLYGVIVIAISFLIAELVIGFTNSALVLVADAFHLTSDLIGYVVAVLSIRLAEASGKQGASQREGFSFGWQRAELLGAAFNGVFLLALGVSVVLQSVDSFINPSELGNPVLIAIIGGAGIASNLLMVALLGGHTHSHSHGTGSEMAELAGSGEHAHADHAHFTRLQPKTGRFDLNVLGVLLHVLGDGINSVAVIISAVVYLKTGWVYADPIATLFGELASRIGRPFTHLLTSGHVSSPNYSRPPKRSGMHDHWHCSTLNHKDRPHAERGCS